MDVDSMRVIEALKRRIADLAAEAAVLNAVAEQTEIQLAEAQQRIAELEAKLAVTELGGENNASRTN
jgi:hypothetical protein